MTTESFMDLVTVTVKGESGRVKTLCSVLCAPEASQSQRQRTGVSAPHEFGDQRITDSVADSTARTILGWKSVPATRVAIAIRSLCPQNTLTSRACESSGRFTGLPLRMRAVVASSAVTDGMCGRRRRG